MLATINFMNYLKYQKLLHQKKLKKHLEIKQ